MVISHHPTRPPNRPLCARKCERLQRCSQLRKHKHRMMADSLPSALPSKFNRSVARALLAPLNTSDPGLLRPYSTRFRFGSREPRQCLGEHSQSLLKEKKVDDSESQSAFGSASVVLHQAIDLDPLCWPRAIGECCRGKERSYRGAAHS